MRFATHKKITKEMTKELGFNDDRIELFAIFADLNKKKEYGYDSYNPNLGLDLTRHHDINLNRPRIKKLIFQAKWAYQNGQSTYPIKYKIYSLFDYCNAIHFLCDSVIPPLSNSCDKDTQKNIEQQFENIKLNPPDNDIPRIPEEQVDNMIDKFLDTMPIETSEAINISKSPELENIYSEITKLLYFIGIGLGKFTFDKH